MKCPSEVELNEYAEDRLDTRRRWEVQEHLDECVGCRSDLESLQWTTRQLALLAREAAEVDHPSDEDLAAMAEGTLEAGERARVLTHLGQCPECAAIYGALPRRKRSFVVPRSLSGLAAAAALLLAIGIFYVTGGYRQEPGFAPPPRPAKEMAAQPANEDKKPVAEKAAPAKAIAPAAERGATAKAPAKAGAAMAPVKPPKPVAAKPAVAPVTTPSAPAAEPVRTAPRAVQQARVGYHRGVTPPPARITNTHRTLPEAAVQAPRPAPPMPALPEATPPSPKAMDIAAVRSGATMAGASAGPDKAFSAAAVMRGGGDGLRPAAPAAAARPAPGKVGEPCEGTANQLVVSPQAVDRLKAKAATKDTLRKLARDSEEKQSAAGAKVRSNRLDRDAAAKVKGNVKTKARLRGGDTSHKQGTHKNKLAGRPVSGGHAGHGAECGAGGGLGKALAQQAPDSNSATAQCSDSLSGGARHAER